MIAVQTFLDSSGIRLNFMFIINNDKLCFMKYVRGVSFANLRSDEEFLSKYILTVGDGYYFLYNLVYNDKVIGDISIKCNSIVSKSDGDWFLVIRGVDYSGRGIMPYNWDYGFMRIGLDNSFVVQNIIENKDLVIDVLREVYAVYDGNVYKVSDLVQIC